MRQLLRVSMAASALALVCGSATAQDAPSEEAALELDGATAESATVPEPELAPEAATAEATPEAMAAPDAALAADTVVTPEAAVPPPEEVATIPLTPAEPEQVESEAPGVKNRLIEEIIVTAQKREENTQDVPISIQAFSTDSLSVRNVVTTQDLGALVPSLRFTEAAGYTLIYMRGIGTSQFVPSADPSIATYIDGIYVPQGQGGVQSLSLGNTERVEVLKGPQGTLFGRNSIGGAINVVTKKPNRDEWEGSGEVSYTDLNHRSVRAGISGPITSWLSASLSGGYTENENYLNATLFDVPDAEIASARASLQFDPTDTLSIGITGNFSDLNNAQLSIGQNTQPYPVGALFIPPQGDDFTVGTDFPANANSDLRLLYGDLVWNLPWLDFKILASSQEVNIPQYDYDFDGSGLPLVGFDTTNEFTHARTGEIQFVSNDESWLSDRLQWIFGLYYYGGTAAFDPARFHVAPGLIAQLPFPQSVFDILDTLPLVSTPLGTDGLSLALRGILKTDSYSVFTQATYDITDWLDITIGGRYQDEDRNLTKAETNFIQPNGVDEINLLSFRLDSTNEKNFSPKLQFGLRPYDDALIYLSYTKGFKSGTYNIVNIYTAPDYIVPEEVETYELGAKMDFLDGGLRVNAAIFNNELTNLQDGFVSLLSGGAVSFNTAPAARTRGFEFDLLWLPFPEWNDGLVLTANGAYVDGEYTDFKQGEGFDGETRIYRNNIDLSGFKLRNTPETSGSVGLVQTIALANGTLEIGGDVYFNSGFFYSANNTVEEPAYELYSARVSYAYDPWQMRVTVFGQNLSDERHHVAKFETDFGLQTTLAAPRAIGMSLNWAF